MDEPIGRLGYCFGVVLTVIVCGVLIVFGALAFSFIKTILEMLISYDGNLFDNIILYTSILFVIMGFAVNIFLSSLRCRDLKINPYFSFLILVPFVNLLFVLYLMVTPGETSKEISEKSVKKRDIDYVTDESLTLEEVFKAAPDVEDDLIYKKK